MIALVKTREEGPDTIRFFLRKFELQKGIDKKVTVLLFLNTGLRYCENKFRS